MTDDNPTEKIDRLAKTVHDKLEDLGLEQFHFSISARNPQDPHSEPLVQVIWKLDPERAFETDEQRAQRLIDEQFKEMTRQDAARTKIEENDAEVERIKKEAAERVKQLPSTATPVEKKEYKDTKDMLGGIDI